MIGLDKLYNGQVGDVIPCPKGMMGHLLPVEATLKIHERAQRGERHTIGAHLMVHGVRAITFDVDLTMEDGKVKLVSLGVAR